MDATQALRECHLHFQEEMKGKAKITYKKQSTLVEDASFNRAKYEFPDGSVIIWDLKRNIAGRGIHRNNLKLWNLHRKGSYEVFPIFEWEYYFVHEVRIHIRESSYWVSAIDWENPQTVQTGYGINADIQHLIPTAIPTKGNILEYNRNA